MNVAHLLVDTVTVAEQNGVSNSGSPTYGSQTTVAVRLEQKRTIQIGTDGNEQVSDHVTISTTKIGQNALVWFPAQGSRAADDTNDNNAARRPIAVVQATTPAGDALYETYF